MTLRTRLYCVTGFTIVTLVGLIAFSSSKMSELGSEVEKMTEQSFRPVAEVNVPQLIDSSDALQLLLNADRDAYQALAAEKLMLSASEEEHGAIVADHTEQVAQVAQRAAQAAEHMEGEAAEVYSRFLKAYDEWEAATTKVVTQAQDPSKLNFARRGSTGSAAAAFDAMRGTLDEMSNILEADSAAAAESVDKAFVAALQHSEDSQQHAAEVISMFVVMSAICGLIISGLLVFTALSVTGSLRALLHRMENVTSGAADLTQRVELKRSDEVGDLAKAFNVILDRFESVVIYVRDASSEVLNATDGIREDARQTQDQIQRQTSGVGQMSAAITELTASSEEVARACMQVSVASEEARKLAGKGAEVVGSTVETMTTISTAFQEGAESVRQLGVSVESISQLTTVINDIADQTNLLALNAAIEAARAGEHGRGFAVVADEVRKLADRTTRATEEIVSSIRAIQAQTQSSVNRMEAGREHITQGSALASEAGGSLKLIDESSEGVSMQISQISAAASEQTDAARSIDQETEQATQGLTAIGDAMSSTLTRIESLQASSNRLSAMVGEYKVGGAKKSAGAHESDAGGKGSGKKSGKESVKAKKAA